GRKPKTTPMTTITARARGRTPPKDTPRDMRAPPGRRRADTNTIVIGRQGGKLKCGFLPNPQSTYSEAGLLHCWSRIRERRRTEQQESPPPHEAQRGAARRAPQPGYACA